MKHNFKINKTYLLMQLVSLVIGYIGVLVLWGQWKLLAGLFILMFANNLSQIKKEDL